MKTAFFKRHWHIFALILIAGLSFGLNFYEISNLGYGNAYYAAAIKSMAESFKNFFYVSFDPAGMVSVDKPPLGLWVQALFVLAFGYHGWAMLLPQALAGAASTVMMYVLTAKHFGRPAGLIASLVFALTPAVVVASRNNTMDMQLVFVLLVATWFLFRAIERSRWRYLFLAALFVGLGFNIKMLQAYMILPAVALVYLIFAKEKFLRRLAAGLISIAIMAVVSFAWVVAVDLTPSGSRPYVDSSTNNTVSELIIGHNGLERIYGQGSGTGGMGGGRSFGGGQGFGQGRSFGEGQGTGNQTAANGQNATNNTNTANAANNNTNGAPPAMPNQNGGTNNTPGSGTMQQGGGQFGGGNGRGMGGAQGAGGVAGNEIGSAGLLRLWTSSIYGQASWLIVLALFGIAAMARKVDLKRLTLRQGVFAYWVIWLAAMYLFFSFGGFWHRYYLCMIAPCVAALAGIGLVRMVRDFRDRQGFKQVLLPLSLLVTFGIEIVYVWSYSALRAWLVPLMIAAAAVALILMAAAFIGGRRVTLVAATGFMLASLLAAPCYWALTAVMYAPQNVTMPYAGPELASQTTTAGMTPNQETLTTGDSGTLTLEKYLVAHYKKGSYLVVSQRADDVAQFIVDTGLPAVAYGGFLGSDNSMTLDQFKALVKQGKITYFLVSGQGQGGSSSSEIISYVEQNATKIDASEYGLTSTQAVGQSGGTLYCFK